MNNILEVNNLVKKYDSFSLKDVSFKVPTGLIMGFIGQNGAGKTTTIKSILNMITPDTGSINLFGLDNRINTKQINEQIGVVLDVPFFVDEWNINDVENALSPFYSQWEHQKFTELLNRFGIDKKKKINELSRGMKVKLMISVALSHNAKLLILDEPTSGLDPVARDELCDLLSDFVSDETNSVLFSTHITSDLEKIADYITFIFDGQIIFTGLKDDFLEKYLIIKGGLDEITAEQKEAIIGFREHQTGFEGMIEATHANKLPKTLLFERPTLEEIIVFMNKGGKHNE
jgi:ABC-type multidrug transport system, ATPase component